MLVPIRPGTARNLGPTVSWDGCWAPLESPKQIRPGARGYSWTRIYVHAQYIPLSASTTCQAHSSPTRHNDYIALGCSSQLVEVCCFRVLTSMHGSSSSTAAEAR